MEKKTRSHLIAACVMCAAIPMLSGVAMAEKIKQEPFDYSKNPGWEGITPRPTMPTDLYDWCLPKKATPCPTKAAKPTATPEIVYEVPTVTAAPTPAPTKRPAPQPTFEPMEKTGVSPATLLPLPAGAILVAGSLFTLLRRKKK